MHWFAAKWNCVFLFFFGANKIHGFDWCFQSKIYFFAMVCDQIPLCTAFWHLKQRLFEASEKCFLMRRNFCKWFVVLCDQICNFFLIKMDFLHFCKKNIVSFVLFWCKFFSLNFFDLKKAYFIRSFQCIFLFFFVKIWWDADLCHF